MATRINKYLSEVGCSRREADRLDQGKVTQW